MPRDWLPLLCVRPGFVGERGIHIPLRWRPAAPRGIRSHERGLEPVL